MNPETDDEIQPTSINQMLTHIKENPIAYAVGVLVLQQLGWLTKAASELQGVCF